MGVVLLAPKTNIYTVTVATARGTEFLRGSVYLSFQLFNIIIIAIYSCPVARWLVFPEQ